MKKPLIIILVSSTVLVFIFLVLSTLNQRAFSGYNDSGSGKKLTDKMVYTSIPMRFEVEVPTEFEVEETELTISVKDNLGEILISRNGTEYDDLKDHLEFGAQMNGLEIISLTWSIIDGHESINTVAESDEGQEYYLQYIKVQDTVYAFSTSHPNLYDELDQIAQSFKYLGY